MKRCTNCILPETYPDIEFSSEGCCNQCRNFAAPKLLGRAALQVLVENARKPDKAYDCIVALSGGRDSTYVLAYVVDELGMRPLVLTVDNGFMPNEIKQSIRRAVITLGVEHVFVQQRVTMDHFARYLKIWEYRPDPAMIAFLCNGCQGSIKTAVKRTACDNGSELIFGGGGDVVGEGGEPEGSFAEPLLGLGIGFRNRRLAMALGGIKRILSNRKYLAHPPVLLSYIREAYFRFWMKYPDDFNVVGLFSFIEWNEDLIVSTIRQRLGWQEPPCWNSTWRADCMVHWLKELMYLETLGFTKNDELLSGMVREGMISRDEALTRLAAANRLPIDAISDLLAEHGTSIDQIYEACQRWRASQLKE